MTAFFFHYNKPKSKAAGTPIISLHYKQQCFFIKNIECAVPTKGRIRNTQPYFVIAGKANQIVIDEDYVAHIS